MFLLLFERLNCSKVTCSQFRLLTAQLYFIHMVQK
jgi:hypothetical protein